MDPKTALIVAAISFFGGLISGTITARVNYILAVRHETIEAAKDRDNAAREITRTARLIEVELLSFQAVLDLLIEDQTSWDPRRPVKTEAWQQYSHILAPELSRMEWGKVATVYATINSLSAALNLSPEIKQITAMATLYQNAKAAVDALEPHVRDRPLTTTIKAKRWYWPPAWFKKNAAVAQR